MAKEKTSPSRDKVASRPADTELTPSTPTVQFDVGPMKAPAAPVDLNTDMEARRKMIHARMSNPDWPLRSSELRRQYEWELYCMGCGKWRRGAIDTQTGAYRSGCRAPRKRSMAEQIINGR